MVWWLLIVTHAGALLLGFALGFLTRRRGKSLRILFSLEAQGYRGELDQSGTPAVPSPVDPGAPSTAAREHPQETEHPPNQ